MRSRPTPHASRVLPLLTRASSHVHVALDRRHAKAYLAANRVPREAAPRLVAELSAACRHLDRHLDDPNSVDRERIAELADAMRLVASAWASIPAPPRHQRAHDLLSQALWRAVEAATELDKATTMTDRGRWFQVVFAAERACTAERMWASGWCNLVDSVDELGLGGQLEATGSA